MKKVKNKKRLLFILNYIGILLFSFSIIIALIAGNLKATPSTLALLILSIVIIFIWAIVAGFAKVLKYKNASKDPFIVAQETQFREQYVRDREIAKTNKRRKKDL